MVRGAARTGDVSGVTDRPDLVEVRLLGLPVKVHERAAAHMADLQRELELIRRSTSEDGSVPHRLQALVADLQVRFGGVSDQPVAELAAAAERGDELVDLSFLVPPEAADAAQALGDMLGEVDEYCRRGEHVLSLVTPEESLRYRHWYLGEFIRQIRGARPSPWPSDTTWTPARGVDDAVAEVVGRTSVPAGWSVDDDGTKVTIYVEGALDLESAPTLRDLLAEVASTRQVTADLTRVSFLDSVGTSVLIAGHLRACADGGALRLVVARRVHELLGVMGLDDQFTILVVDGTAG